MPQTTCDLRWVLLGIALWNTVFCTSGVCFGFAALDIPSEVFLVSGGPVFSFATSFIGPIVDTYGPRFASVGGAGVAAIGYGVLSLSDAGEADVAAYIGLALVVFGSIGPYLGSFCVGALFATPEVPIAVITGLFCAAGLDFDLCQKLGLSRNTVLFLFLGLQIFGMCLCILGVPSRPHLPGKPRQVLLERVLGCSREEEIARPNEESRPHGQEASVTGQVPAEPDASPRGSEQDASPRGSAPMASPMLGVDARPASLVIPRYWQRRRHQEERRRTLLSRARQISRRISEIRLERGTSLGDLASAPFLAQATSPEYIGIVFWYTLNLTWILYFFTYAGSIVNNGLFCSLVIYIGNGLPAVLSLFCGGIIVRCGWGAVTMATSLLTMAMFALTTAQSLWLSYVALVLFCITRSFVFAVFFSYIPVTFGANNYGKLIGVATFFSGAFGFVNNPIGQWAGLGPNHAARCSTGIACQTAQGCNRTSLVLAATLAPGLLYSAWLCRRSRNKTESGQFSSSSSPRFGPDVPSSPNIPNAALESAAVVAA